MTEHENYLKEISSGDNPLISQETFTQALSAWKHLCEIYLMPVPSACTGPDGRLLFCWDKENHHLELEFIPNQAAEFFYRDRNSEEMWSEDYEPHIMSQRLTEKLSIFEECSEEPILFGWTTEACEIRAAVKRYSDT